MVVFPLTERFSEISTDDIDVSLNTDEPLTTKDDFSLLFNAACNPLTSVIAKSPAPMLSCFASNAACNPFVLAMVRPPSTMLACFPSNAACNPFVLAMVSPPSTITFCFPSNAVCNPFVLAMVRPPSAITSCFPFNAVVKLVFVVFKLLTSDFTPLI